MTQTATYPIVCPRCRGTAMDPTAIPATQDDGSTCYRSQPCTVCGATGMLDEPLPDPLNPHTWPVDGTPSDRLRHALAWTLEAYERALAGKPTAGTDVISFAQSVLRDGVSG